jgi:hypothetical protein
MAYRTRDLCNASLDYAIDAGLLGGYQHSGRYRPQPQSRNVHRVDQDIKLLAHYARCDGELYREPLQWQQGYRMVKGFVDGGSFGHRWWNVPDSFGRFAGIDPALLIELLGTALLRIGFEAVDQHPASFTALFASHDECSVASLPEPYGKWLQHREHQPRWRQQSRLTVELDCRAHPAGERDARVDLRLSALAAPMIPALWDELAPLLFLDAAEQQRRYDGLQRALPQRLASALRAG